MFWIAIILPITFLSIGVFLLYSNASQSSDLLFPIDNALTQPIRNGIDKSRNHLIQFSERQVDKSEIRNRLEEIGRSDARAYGEFRYGQLMVASCASLIPFVAAFLMIINLFQAVGFAIFLGIGAYFLYDNFLTTKVKRHREQIEAEFPAIIEMLALAIAAGESPITAFNRISERSESKLAKQFSEVVSEVKEGAPFHEALDRLGRSLKSQSIRRFVDALVMAMERGAPIVDVLHRHVAEARINQRNLVMDKAGKAETTMMIPIVFLILPISVLFALWPSINQLSFFAS